VGGIIEGLFERRERFEFESIAAYCCLRILLECFECGTVIEATQYCSELFVGIEEPTTKIADVGHS
jgi:hypothetical protein